jgi:hypothetical protein
MGHPCVLDRRALDQDLDGRRRPSLLEPSPHELFLHSPTGQEKSPLRAYRSGVLRSLTREDLYYFGITKFTVLTWLPVTVTDFSHVLASVKTGRCTLCSVSTS